MKQIIIAIFIFAVILLAFSPKSNAQKTKPTEMLPNKFSETNSPTSKYEELIDCYLESLNETGSQRRSELIKAIWTENGIFAYPEREVKGFSEIESDVEHVQKQYPGAKVRRVSRIEIVHNNYVRFNWEFGQPGEKPIIAGVDFAVIVGEKLQLVVGFFDTVPDQRKK
ncbi:MAG: hypothetical protein ABJA66_13450 [Actinomycetota bacterium]